MKIIGHIIGLDEIHKKKLIKQLSNHIKIIDLDEIQQTVYNNDDIDKQKKNWENISNNILIRKKQNKLIGSKNNKSNNIENEIKKLVIERNRVQQNIHNTWKDNISDYINTQLVNHDDHDILFIGFNIFPKDYRIKINLPLPIIPTDPNNPLYSNKIIFDIKPIKYAANQIKYYLQKYSDKIIRGSFPIKLLQIDYLVNKYEKFTQFYDKQGYKLVPQDEIYSLIIQLDKQLIESKNISGKNIYIATIYKSGDIIPVNINTPIEGFLTKDEAINHIRPKLKNNVPIYIYEIKADDFHLHNGKIIATRPLKPFNEESMLLTI